MKKLKLICLTILNVVLITAVANANVVDRIVEKAAGGKSKDLVQGELSFSGTTIWILLAILLISSSLLNLAFQIAGQFGGVSSTPVGDSLQSTITGTTAAAATGAGALLGAGAKKTMSLGRQGIRALRNRSADSAASAGTKDYEGGEDKKGDPGKDKGGDTGIGGNIAGGAGPGNGGSGGGGGTSPSPQLPLPNGDDKKDKKDSLPDKKDDKKNPDKLDPNPDKKSRSSAGVNDFEPGSSVETPNREKPSLVGRMMRFFGGESKNDGIQRDLSGQYGHGFSGRERDLKDTGSPHHSLLDDMKQTLSEIKGYFSNQKGKGDK